MMYYKILLIQILFTGATVSLPRAQNAVLNTGSLTNYTVNETSQIVSNMSTLKDKVQLTVYYETHCPFSVDFFVNQLRPAVLKLGSHLDLYLVPYGNAQTIDVIGSYSFTCQHGSIECHGNMVHACVINNIHNKTLAVLFNSCLMNNSYDYTNIDIIWCAVVEKVSVTNILACVNGTSSSLLLKSHGEVTRANRVSYVPHLTFDGSAEREDEGRDDLIATVCEMLNPPPVECSHS